MKPHLLCSVILTVAGLSACAHHGSDVASRNDADEPMSTTLNAYHWQLDRAVTASGDADMQWILPNRPQQPLTLTFHEQQQRLVVSGLCNPTGASYDVDGSNIHVSQVASTMMMCPDESLMRYEQAVGQRLPQASSWNITRMHDEPVHQPSLTLRFQDGAQWVLKGSPTAETEYGSTGETLFLEVAAQAVPCSDPLINNRQCLNVRTINYDAAGLQQGQGPWEAFYGTIDNYQHTPGVRNVLRVKRYTRKDAPADGSDYAYTLDMIVESEAINH